MNRGKKERLGRGLEALLGDFMDEEGAPPAAEIELLPVRDIRCLGALRRFRAPQSDRSRSLWRNAKPIRRKRRSAVASAEFDWTP